jgi:acetolactate synthase-1/2/3 large subunit
MSGNSRAGNMRTGGQILVDQLLIHGVDHVFCVPGESYLATLDALHSAADRIRLIVCRHEGGAATMAESYGKLTGKPGICFVTRGPGASHAMIGVHTAHEDATPLILFVGQVDRAVRGREAFQEIDTKAFFGSVSKWAADIDSPERIPEQVSHAFHLACAGRCGPVVLGLPEDMQTERSAVPDLERYRVVRPAPSPADIESFTAVLSRSRRPLLLIGGGGWTARSTELLAAFAERHDLPVAASFRCQDHLDNRHPGYVGDLSAGIDPALGELVQQADLIVSIGPRIGELTTRGYTLVTSPRPQQRLVHVLPNADDLGRVYQGEALIVSSQENFLAAIAGMPQQSARQAWGEWRRKMRATYEATRKPESCPGTLDLGQAMLAFNEAAPENLMCAVDAGNFNGWVHRFVQARGFRSMIGPANGAMGYAIPAAIAAKFVAPDRPLVVFVGDGGFMMTASELATAAQYGLSMTVVVFNNGLYGTIRMYQEQQYPDRYPATQLVNPDFVAFAKSFGAFATRVERTEDFMPAMQAAMAHKGLSLVELRYDPEAITTRATLSGLKAKTLAARARAVSA